MHTEWFEQNQIDSLEVSSNIYAHLASKKICSWLATANVQCLSNKSSRLSGYRKWNGRVEKCKGRGRGYRWHFIVLFYLTGNAFRLIQSLYCFIQLLTSSQRMDHTKVQRSLATAVHGYVWNLALK